MGDPTPPDHPRIMGLLRQLDELIAEARRLRQHIETAARENLSGPSAAAPRVRPRNAGVNRTTSRTCYTGCFGCR